MIGFTIGEQVMLSWSRMAKRIRWHEDRPALPDEPGNDVIYLAIGGTPAFQINPDRRGGRVAVGREVDHRIVSPDRQLSAVDVESVLATLRQAEEYYPDPSRPAQMGWQGSGYKIEMYPGEVFWAVLTPL